MWIQGKGGSGGLGCRSFLFNHTLKVVISENVLVDVIINLIYSLTMQHNALFLYI